MFTLRENGMNTIAIFATFLLIYAYLKEKVNLKIIVGYDFILLK